MTKRELNQNTAQVLASVDAGETVVVTERGIPRWRIEPVGGPSPIERLRAEGRIRSARANPRPWVDEPGARRYTSQEIDQLLADSRGDR